MNGPTAATASSLLTAVTVDVNRGVPLLLPSMNENYTLHCSHESCTVRLHVGAYVA